MIFQLQAGPASSLNFVRKFWTLCLIFPLGWAKIREQRTFFSRALGQFLFETERKPGAFAAKWTWFKLMVKSGLTSRDFLMIFVLSMTSWTILRGHLASEEFRFTDFTWKLPLSDLKQFKGIQMTRQRCVRWSRFKRKKTIQLVWKSSSFKQQSNRLCVSWESTFWKCF